MMLKESRIRKGFFEESERELSAKFEEAGFGFLQDGTQLFHPLEAGYLLKIGKTSFGPGGLRAFLASQKKKSPRFPFSFAVFCTIREKGRLIRPYAKSKSFFRVYAPGVGRLGSRPSQLLCLAPGKFPPAKSLESAVRLAHLARLELVFACGDAKHPRFYKTSTFNF